MSSQFVVAVIGGLLQGSTIVLIAIGLVLAYRATDTFSFAHGQMMVLPAVFAVALQANGVPLVVALLGALGAGIAVAVMFQLTVLQKTINQPVFVGTVATLGFAAILNGILGVAFPGDKNSVLEVAWLPDSLISIFGARIRVSVILVAGLSLLIALAVCAMLRWTHLGIKLTAVGQDPLVASQGGIRVRRLHALTWAVVAALAAAAGLAQATTTGVGTSSIALGMLAFPAIILGGLTSVEGTIVAGLLIGVLQQFVASYAGGDKVDVVTYTVLLLVIMLRPEGVFGIKNVSRA